MIKEEILRCSKDKEELIIIYPSGPDGKHFAGIVKFISEEYVLLQCVNADGFKDGYDVFRKNDISYLSIDDKYAQRLNKLIKYRCLKFNDKLEEYPAKDCNMFYWIGSVAKQNSKLLSIYTFNEEYNIISRVIDVNKDRIYVKVYDYYGIENGTREIKYEEIDNIFYDTIVEKVEEILIK